MDGLSAAVENLATESGLADVRVVPLGPAVEVGKVPCYDALDSSALRFTAEAYELVAPAIFRACVGE